MIESCGNELVAPGSHSSVKNLLKSTGEDDVIQIEDDTSKLFSSDTENMKDDYKKKIAQLSLKKNHAISISRRITDLEGVLDASFFFTFTLPTLLIMFTA